MSDELAAGFILGTSAAFLAILILWHTGESVCLQRNNVSDCKLAKPLFVPATSRGEDE